MDHQKMLIVQGAKELVTMAAHLQSSENPAGVIPDGSVVVEGEKIVWIGKSHDLPENYRRLIALLDHRPTAKLLFHIDKIDDALIDLLFL